jgi:hypothetical protein
MTIGVSRAWWTEPTSGSAVSATKFIELLKAARDDMQRVRGIWRLQQEQFDARSADVEFAN